MYEDSAFLLRMGIEVASRHAYDANPFVESIEIARYIKSHTTPEDTIAVIGSEPQLYFYTQRRSATGYIYTYALMEYQPYALEMQHEMASEIEKAAPKYIVFVDIQPSWLVRPKSPKWIFEEWMPKYRQYYDRVGVIDILADGATYKWDEAAAKSGPTSPYWMMVWKRK
jgi:hypothetical protein